MPLPVINAIWIGREMGPLHAACLRSFLATDHKVILHAYGEVDDAPAGVEYADANLLFDEAKLFRDKRQKSYAVVADLMRYEIMRRGLGLYVDCDMYCYRPMEDAEYVFGWETGTSINNAVLKMPPDSALTRSLVAMREHGWVPPWPTRRKPYLVAMASVGLPVHPGRLPWGWTGPVALTWHARQHGVVDMAFPCDVFYPLDWNRTHMLLDPELTLSDVVTSRTRYIHVCRLPPQQLMSSTGPIAQIIRPQTSRA